MPRRLLPRRPRLPRRLLPRRTNLTLLMMKRTLLPRRLSPRRLLRRRRNLILQMMKRISSRLMSTRQVAKKSRRSGMTLNTFGIELKVPNQ